jgi:hypothetical protein
LFIECYQESSNKNADDEYDFEDDFEIDDDYDFSLSNKNNSKSNNKKNDKSQLMDAFVKRIHIKSSKNKVISFHQIYNLYLMGFIDSTFICQIVFKRSNGIPD